VPTPEQVTAGQAIYAPWTLRNDDWFVLGFSNRFLWRCPTAELRRLQRNLSADVDVTRRGAVALFEARAPGW